MLSLQQIRWCSYLVRKIGGNALEVGKVCAALSFAHNDMHRLTTDNIKFLANLINQDVKGWREINVKLNDLDVGSDFGEIDTHMTQLVEAWDAGRCDPKHFYWEYEAIHPFGTNVNHPVGCIVFNWCNHTVGAPHNPPAYMMGDGS